jgi:hypothetical protein
MTERLKSAAACAGCCDTCENSESKKRTCSLATGWSALPRLPAFSEQQRVIGKDGWQPDRPARREKDLPADVSHPERQDHLRDQYRT